MKRTLLLGTALALAFGAGLATQSIVGAQTQPPAPTAKTIMDEPLIGGIYEQMLMQEVSFQPGAGVPYHIHPDGHEIAYVLEGELKLIGESFEMVDDVLLALGSGLRLMVIVVLEFRQILLHVVDHGVPGQRSKLAGQLNPRARSNFLFGNTRLSLVATRPTLSLCNLGPQN